MLVLLLAIVLFYFFYCSASEVVERPTLKQFWTEMETAKLYLLAFCLLFLLLWRIVLFPYSYLLNKGHRILVLVLGVSQTSGVASLRSEVGL